MRKRTSLLLGLFLVVSTGVFAQKTVSGLGKLVFKSLQSQDLSKLDAAIPSADQTINMAKQKGIAKTDKEFATFKKGYPAQVKQYKSNFQAILDSGKTKGIDWAEIDFGKVEQSEQEIHLGNGGDQSLNITYLDLFFTYQSRQFKIELPGVFKTDGHWYLGGGTVDLEEL